MENTTLKFAVVRNRVDNSQNIAYADNTDTTKLYDFTQNIDICTVKPEALSDEWVFERWARGMDL